jgi:hypothetical protein
MKTWESVSHFLVMRLVTAAIKPNGLVTRQRR